MVLLYQDTEPVDNVVAMRLNDERVIALGHQLNELGLRGWMYMDLWLLKQEERVRGFKSDGFKKGKEIRNTVTDISDVAERTGNVNEDFEDAPTDLADVDSVEEPEVPAGGIDFGEVETADRSVKGIEVVEPLRLKAARVDGSYAKRLLWSTEAVTEEVHESAERCEILICSFA